MTSLQVSGGTATAFPSGAIESSTSRNVSRRRERCMMTTCSLLLVEIGHLNIFYDREKVLQEYFTNFTMNVDASRSKTRLWARSTSEVHGQTEISRTSPRLRNHRFRRPLRDGVCRTTSSRRRSDPAWHYSGRSQTRDRFLSRVRWCDGEMRPFASMCCFPQCGWQRLAPVDGRRTYPNPTPPLV